MECRVSEEFNCGTHSLFLGEVVGARRLDTEAAPMTYDYYHNVVKGKSPSSAPTYLG
jgi:ferric-chelate reductase [NAD(P)H]